MDDVILNMQQPADPKRGQVIENLVEPPLGQHAPWLLNEYYGHELWVWLALPLGFAAAYLVSSLVVRLASAVLYWALSHRYKLFYQRYIASLVAPVELWIGVVVFAALAHLLPLDEDWRKGVGYVIGTAATFAVVWALFRLITNIGEALRERFIAHGKASAAAIIPLMRKLAKTFLATMALLFLLQNWGFDVAALLAGLGIGGVAIALASQKTVENIFGGVSVTLDQPVRVGDYISYGENVGTVEDIGLRSVSIRTLQRTRVTIPNAQFAEMTLENYAARDKILLQKTIGLRYETTPDQIRYVVMRINELFIKHPKVEKDGYARFTGFGASSLDIELYAYTRAASWADYLVIQEDLLLRIMEIVQEAGSDFAFPSTTVYLERGHGLAQENQERIRAEIERLRGTASFPFPTVPEETKSRIADTLEYPADMQEKTV